MRAALTAPCSATHVTGIRAYGAADVPSLGSLMYRAYLGTVDYDGETPEQSADEIARTVEGAYGEFMPDCSRVMVRDSALRSAALLTRFENRPFMAFTFTDPACRKQGFARACMQAAMAALFHRGERELRLVVTRTNTPAVCLYSSLGFEFERG